MKKFRENDFEPTNSAATVHRDFINTLLSNDPEIRRIPEEIYYKYLPELLAFIERGKEEGFIDRDISTEAIVFYFELLKEVKSTEVFREKGGDPRMMKEIPKLFFYGLIRRRT